MKWLPKRLEINGTLCWKEEGYAFDYEDGDHSSSQIYYIRYRSSSSTIAHVITSTRIKAYKKMWDELRNLIKELQSPV